MHGQFTWYELMTTDPAAAQRFYSAVTGWGVQSWDQSPSDNPYRMWTTGDTPLGGLMPLSAEQKAMGVPPNWLAYVDVDNAQDTIRRATSMGGKVLFGPETMPQVGTFAALSDPQGAVFAILQPANRAPAYDGTPRVGHMSWHELLTTDMNAAWTFYSQLFNWKKSSAHDMGSDVGIYQEFGQGARSFGAMFNRSGRMANVPPAWFLYVNVKDAEAARDAAVRGGGKVIIDLMDVPGGDRIAMFADPQGAMIAVHQTAAKSTAKKATKKTAKKAARKTAKRPARKTGKKTARKTAKKTAKTARKRPTKRRAPRRGKRKR